MRFTSVDWSRAAEGPSRMVRVGQAMRPRAIATICCSPPERVGAGCPQRAYLAERGGPPGPRLRGAGAQEDVLAHREGREEPPPLDALAAKRGVPARPRAMMPPGCTTETISAGGRIQPFRQLWS
jgi:hypothetical protein